MAQRPKAKPKSKGPKSTDKKQSERFIETARALGVDESGKEFELGLQKILRPENRRKLTGNIDFLANKRRGK